MKSSKFFEMTNEELEMELTSLKEKLFNLRFQQKASQVENPLLIRTTKRDIARVNTVLSQRKLGISEEPKKAAKKAK